MSNYRIKLFQQSFKNHYLITPEQLNQFYEEYNTEILKELEHLVEECSPDNNKILFIGHPKSGKSTLLKQFSQNIKNRFFVVFFSITDLIKISDINHINILYAIVIKLMEIAEKRQIKIDTKTKKLFYTFFSKDTHNEVTGIDYNAEINNSRGSLINTWIMKFCAKLKATLPANSVIQDEIKTDFDRKISDLLYIINDIANAIQVNCKQEIIVIIDDLEKISLKNINQVYPNHIITLFKPQFRIIYTMPMAAIKLCYYDQLFIMTLIIKLQKCGQTNYFDTDKIAFLMPYSYSKRSTNI